MNLSNSLLWDLVTEYKDLRPQTYFKSSLTALTRAMQDIVLADDRQYLVIANFQQEKYFYHLERRFRQMATKSEHVYILGIPEPDSKFAVDNSGYVTIPLAASDTLAGERYLVIIGQKYSACLAMQEKLVLPDSREVNLITEQGTRYEGIWTFDREIAYSAADWLLGTIANFRPELREKTQRARRLFVTKRSERHHLLTTESIDLGIFTRSLVTYLQAGQYKLLKAYKAIATAERKEYLSNKIAATQRSSLNPKEIILTTVQELGLLFADCRCILYQIAPGATEVQIEYESVPVSMTSLLGETWLIADNPLFIAAQAQRSTLVIDDVTNNSYLTDNPILRDKIRRAGIESWLMVSIRYQGTLLGMLELHRGVKDNFAGQPEDIALVEAVANSAGAALTQASAYNNLLELNTQLGAVERIKSNLIAIVGHELRTPLTTIRICLESLASEQDMPVEIKNSMLDTALGDTERLSQLIQNFLTLSKLETGKVYRNLELLTVDYALNLALRQIQTTSRIKSLPEIKNKLSPELPKVLADADGLVDVFSKLLENACKFTPADGKIAIASCIRGASQTDVDGHESSQMLEIIITDTGRGIDAQQLETIFDRFAQSENYLRRTVSGAGLGLVICRQIIEGMGGQIWATSEGENQGSQFHFTLPIERS